MAVLNSEPSKERMLLSFKLLSDSEPKNESDENSQKKGRAVNIGQVPGQVIVSDGDISTRGVLEPVGEKRGGSVRFGGTFPAGSWHERKVRLWHGFTGLLSNC